MRVGTNFKETKMKYSINQDISSAIVDFSQVQREAARVSQFEADNFEFSDAIAWGFNDASDSYHDDKTIEEFVAGIGWNDSDTPAAISGYIIGAYMAKG